MKTLIKKLLRTKIVGKYAQFVLDVNRNENNGNMNTNGEFLIEKDHIHDGDVVFDVGANVGNWSAHCLTLAPHARIHAFEPVQQTYQTLLKQNFPTNVTTNNIALGDQEEKRQIMKYASDNGLGTLHKRSLLEIEFSGMEDTRVSTIDVYCEKSNIPKIDFLKIDVEGHEYSVLKGAKRMIAQNAIKAIQFEYGQTYIESRTYLKDIFDLFDQNKYIVYKLYNDGSRKVAYTYDLENMRYANYLVLLRADSNAQITSSSINHRKDD